MKTKHILYSGLLALVILSSCGGSQKASNETESTDANEGKEITFAIDKESSIVNWAGEVAGVYGHKGLIAIKEGQITAKGNQIVSGNVVIDMTAISPTDSASYKDEDGRRATDLVGHLSTGDFFLVEEFPTSSFVIKSHTGNNLVGDLTIRGTTKEVTATLTSLEVTAEGLQGTADLVFNRQDFKVNWVHFMKDMVLSDDIKINLNIVAKP